MTWRCVARKTAVPNSKVKFIEIIQNKGVLLYDSGKQLSIVACTFVHRG